MRRQTELPDPDRLPEGDVVIFDGQCNFCRAGVDSLRRLDWSGRRLAFLSLHDPRVAQRYPDLSQEDLLREMYVIDSQSNRHAGADAVRYLSRRLPSLWLFAPLMHLPGTAGLWRWIYRQIAKRRYKIAGQHCENDACQIHFDDH